jgi:signal-transduction protein with cAMP-binding, CBS, and nucleotidyltransferase domain
VLVKDIATRDVTTVSAEKSLHDAVTAMHADERPYCVVEVDGIPSGVVTEHTALVACLKSGRSLKEIPLKPFATGFEVAVMPHKTIYYAVGLMVSHELEVLPVKDGLEIVGMITQDHVLENLEKLTRSTISNLGRGEKWNA